MTFPFILFALLYTIGMMACGIVIGFFWFRKNYIEIIDGQMENIVNEINCGL